MLRKNFLLLIASKTWHCGQTLCESGKYCSLNCSTKKFIRNMPVVCRFELEHENKVYISGQDDVKGRIFLTVTDENNIKDITIEFRGFTKCTMARKETSTIFRSHDSHVRQITTIKSNGEILVGDCNFPFIFTVPDSCPTSVEGAGGHIRYELHAVIKGLKKGQVYTCAKPISVLKLSDMMRNINTPIESGFDTELDIGLTKGKIGFTLSIVHGSYVPGENLEYSVYLNNVRWSPITAFEVTFVRTMLFMYKIPATLTRFSEKILYKKNIADERDTQCIEHLSFVIPSTPPTTCTNILSVNYILRLQALSGTTSINYSVDLPVFICTNLADGRVIGENIPPETKPNGISEDGEMAYYFQAAYRPEQNFYDMDRLDRHEASRFQPLYIMYSAL